VTATYGARWDV